MTWPEVVVLALMCLTVVALVAILAWAGGRQPVARTRYEPEWTTSEKIEINGDIDAETTDRLVQALNRRDGVTP